MRSCEVAIIWPDGWATSYSSKIFKSFPFWNIFLDTPTSDCRNFLPGWAPPTSKVIADASRKRNRHCIEHNPTSETNRTPKTWKRGHPPRNKGELMSSIRPCKTEKQSGGLCLATPVCGFGIPPKNVSLSCLYIIILTMALARVLVLVLLIQRVVKELAKCQMTIDMLNSLIATVNWMVILGQSSAYGKSSASKWYSGQQANWFAKFAPSTVAIRNPTACRHFSVLLEKDDFQTTLLVCLNLTRNLLNLLHVRMPI